MPSSQTSQTTTDMLARLRSIDIELKEQGAMVFSHFDAQGERVHKINPLVDELSDLRDRLASCGHATVASNPARERYSLVKRDCVRCDCGARLWMMKPAAVSRLDLNDERLRGRTNIFLICWVCRTVMQEGYGEL